MMIGSLFAGIGGLDLGLERAGLGPVMWQVEQDAFCRQVLAKHWPNADRSVTDVREAGPHNLCEVGIICGGFPCQDVSSAGLGAGLAGDRSGLWYQYRRIVRDMQPRFVVVENVASGATRWLCEVRSGLQALGYRTRALGIAARDVGAPHRRERIFVVAYADGLSSCSTWTKRAGRSELGRGGRDAAYADGQRIRVAEESRWDSEAKSSSFGSDVGFTMRTGPQGSVDLGSTTSESSWRVGQAECGLGRSTDGLPPGLDRHRWPATRGEAQHEGEPPRTVTQHDPMRRARLRALGNAVVPQRAEIVGHVIQQMRGVLP